ncbi:hypothetical protein HPP92_028407 [Vanilla planifolia]|uniref:Kinesin motor domain-containing protein n=1 Tax=Vanilla planifolia TaxID=51239 RepID=A0A835U485_VANPL|nr:hypothetical protein HPP92_028407 [Vanilla planifolia]
MLEIYNETIRDLLSPNRSTSSCLTLLNKQYTIKHDSAGNTHVPDLTIVDVCSIKEISFLLDQAARSRFHRPVNRYVHSDLLLVSMLVRLGFLAVKPRCDHWIPVETMVE